MVRTPHAAAAGYVFWPLLRPFHCFVPVRLSTVFKFLCARKTPLHLERYYPHARIRVFHHSGPEIPGSAREGKPRSIFLCFAECSSAYSLAWSSLALLVHRDPAVDLSIERLHRVLSSEHSAFNIETLSLAAIPSTQRKATRILFRCSFEMNRRDWLVASAAGYRFCI